MSSGVPVGLLFRPLSDLTGPLSTVRPVVTASMAIDNCDQGCGICEAVTRLNNEGGGREGAS